MTRRKKRSHRFSVLALFAALATIYFWQAPIVHSQTPAPQEIRGIWMTNYGASMSYYSTRLDETIANLAKHHLNTLYPAVWNRGYTLYPSPIAEAAGGVDRDRLTSFPTIPLQDPLKGLVKQAHRQHLRMIPWFEYGLWMPTNSAIAQAHPEWLTTTISGETTSPTGLRPRGPEPRNPLLKPLWNLKQEVVGANQGWLNPFHPEVQQFLVDLIADVVERYDVDGIQLDDHFGLPIEFGYDPYTQDLYRQEHGGAAPPSSPNNTEWVRWRAEKITQLMGRITAAVRAADPEAIVSLSPNPPDFAYQQYLQDWQRWVASGFLDEVIVQVYREDLGALETELAQGSLQVLSRQLPIAIGLYTGPARRAKSADRIEQEATAVRSAGYDGISFFCWETTLWALKGSPADRVHDLFVELFPLDDAVAAIAP
ncbi:MAG: family 10 glycosylhydrolase [Cyanobacteria bacterium J06641_5]